MKREHRVRVDGRDLEIVNPDKVLFPEAGFRKLDLIDYYLRVAPWIVPHLRNRPVAMQRFPDGIAQPGFYQKSVPSFYPDWIETVAVTKREDGIARHVVCNDAPTLVYLANQACITPHVWLSRTDRLAYPDEMVFDLDPSADDAFDLVREAALALKELLEEVGLPPFLKTSGSRGLHVVVPLKREETFEAVREFARSLARVVVFEKPGQRTLEPRKDERLGRVYIDINRNGYAQTLAPAYALRARPRASVSAPLYWAELDNRDLRSDSVTARSIFERLEAGGDPWAGFWERASSLGRARSLLERINAARGVPEETKLR